MAPTLHLWGTPRLGDVDGLAFEPERRFQLLAWLGMRAGEWLPREQAAALLWPGHDPVRARHNLRKVLSEARALPGVAELESTDRAMRWRVATDVAAFESALRADPPQRDAALVLRRGPALQGLDQDANDEWSRWLASTRAALDGRWQRVGHDHLVALTDPMLRGDWAQRLLAFDGLDDLAMEAWLQACLARGAVAAAYQAWSDYAERLASELGIEPPSRLRALIEHAAPPPLGTRSVLPRAAVGALASPSTEFARPAFVGRRGESAALVEALRTDGALVTIRGPGGVGKSRLAAEALPALGRALDVRVLALALHDLDDCTALSRRLAGSLGATLDERADSAGQIGEALAAAAPSLLLLDNAEHLAELPDWLGRVRAAAPRLRVLVTSRARLRTAGEQELPLAGLLRPDDDSRDAEAAAAFDAVRLFELRAQTAQPGFDLAADIDSVLEIVDRCEGWPLSIELAAAWTRLLPVREIAAELRQSLDVLERDPASTGSMSRPDHASQRTVIECSLRMLAPRERETLESIGVFRGAFARASAQAVAGVALPLLASLVDKSLLAVVPPGRFALHPLIGELVRDRLAADAPRAAALHQRHAGYFLQRVANAAADLVTAPQETDRLMATAEPDCLQAMEHAFEHAAAAEQVAHTLPIWVSFFRRSGRAREGARRLRPALHWPAADPLHLRVQARGRIGLAMLWSDVEEPPSEIRALATAGLEQARRADDPLPQVQGLQVLAECASQADDFDQARALLEQAMALAKAQGLLAAQIACLRTLGSAANRRGHYDEALVLLRQARSLAREAGLSTTEADALLAQAEPLLLTGRWGEAEAVLRECRQLMAPLRMRLHYCYVVMMHGAALAELDRLDEAASALAEARIDAEAIGQARYLADIDSYAAWVTAREGQLDAAEAALRRVAQAAHAAGWLVQTMRALLYHGEVLARRGQHRQAAAAWQVVAGEGRIAAGDRDTARRWLAALPAGVCPDEPIGSMPAALSALLGTASPA